MLEEPQAQLRTDCRLDHTVALVLAVSRWDSHTTDALEVHYLRLCQKHQHILHTFWEFGCLNSLVLALGGVTDIANKKSSSFPPTWHNCCNVIIEI